MIVRIGNQLHDLSWVSGDHVMLSQLATARKGCVGLMVVSGKVM